nr:reverse transcriptase domain-containing protein [Tanacetum cinerariifolium]
LANLDASINLMPLSVWNKLSFPKLSPTCVTLKLADRSISRPVGVAKDVFVKVGTFHFPADFVVVDFEADPRVPLILKRSFLKTRIALINFFDGELTLRVGKEAITFNLDQTSRYLANYNDMTTNRIDVIDMVCEEYSQEVLEVDAFLALEDDPTSPEVNQSYFDPEGDILLLEAFLNDDPSLPPPNQGNFLPQVGVYELTTEKSHFMVKEGIILGHKISKNGIEVDKAKVDVIAKLPHPTTIKGVVLGQRQEKHFRPIQYASLTMTEAESNYTTLEKEMLAVVYAFEKFQSYLIMNESIMYTDHFALKYLIVKKDSKARLLCWVLLIQEFKLKVIDTKGAENLAADHLSQLENPHRNVLDPKEINEKFPLETLNMVSFRGNSSTPWARKPLTFSRLATMEPPGDIMAQTTLPRRTPRAIISDHGMHFYNDQFANVMLKYGVTYRLATAYHPQTSGRLKIFSDKLKSHWSGPFTISHVFPYGTVELTQPDGPNFNVNGHRLKHYFGEYIPKLVVPDLYTFANDH